MSDSHLERIGKVITLEGYSYRIWEYQASLSQLVIRARHPGKPKHNIHIVFQGVAYLQMPIYWETGDLRHGTADERVRIARRMGQNDLLDSYTLFVAETAKGPVYILGSVAAILEDVEPLY
jgi:hypothetical protein